MQLADDLGKLLQRLAPDVRDPPGRLQVEPRELAQRQDAQASERAGGAGGKGQLVDQRVRRRVRRHPRHLLREQGERLRLDRRESLLDCRERLGRGGGPLGRVGRERPLEQRSETLRGLGVQRVREQVGLDGGRLAGVGRGAAEGVRAGQELVQDEEGGVEVVGRCPAALRVDQRVLVAVGPDGQLLRLVDPARQTQVDERGPGLGVGEHDVVGLDVSVDVAGRVQRAERAEQAGGDATDLDRVERVAGHGPQAGGHAIDVLEHEDGAFAVGADVVVADQVVMPDRVEDAGLGLEPLGVGQLGDLEDVQAARLGVAGQPGRRRCAPPQAPLELVYVEHDVRGLEVAVLVGRGLPADGILQLGGDEVGVGGPGLGRRVEQPAQQAGDGGGDRPVVGAGRGHVERLEDVVGVGEQRPAREQLPERGSQGEEVAARRGLPGAKRLRGGAPEGRVDQAAPSDRQRAAGDVAGQLERAQPDFGRLVLVADEHGVGGQPPVNELLVVDPRQRPSNTGAKYQASGQPCTALPCPGAQRQQGRGVLELQDDALGIGGRQEVRLVLEQVGHALELAEQGGLAQGEATDPQPLPVRVAGHRVDVEDVALLGEAGRGEPCLVGAVLGGELLVELEVDEPCRATVRLPAVEQDLADLAAEPQRELAGLGQGGRIGERGHQLAPRDHGVVVVGRDLGRGVAGGEQDEPFDPGVGEVPAAGDELALQRTGLGELQGDWRLHKRAVVERPAVPVADDAAAPALQLHGEHGVGSDDDGVVLVVLPAPAAGQVHVGDDDVALRQRLDEEPDAPRLGCVDGRADGVVLGRHQASSPSWMRGAPARWLRRSSPSAMPASTQAPAYSGSEAKSRAAKASRSAQSFGASVRPTRRSSSARVQA